MAKATTAVATDTVAKTEYHNIRLGLYKNNKKSTANQPDYILKRKLSDAELAVNNTFKYAIIGAGWVKTGKDGDYFTINIDEDKMKTFLALAA